MPAELDDIELRSVQLQQSQSRDSISNACDLRRVPTDKGDILVAIQGDVSKPAILTLHDLGLNCKPFSFFLTIKLKQNSLPRCVNVHWFLQLPDNACASRELLCLPRHRSRTRGRRSYISWRVSRMICFSFLKKSLNFFHFRYVYPTMDELAAQILFVMSHFGLKTIIGFGIGAGANILVRFALANHEKVGALCLVNCSSTAAGWIEWGYQSMNTRNLRSKGMTQGVLDYLMWHHFGRAPEERNLDLVSMYKSYFERSINPVNLVKWISFARFHSLTLDYILGIVHWLIRKTNRHEHRTNSFRHSATS